MTASSRIRRFASLGLAGILLATAIGVAASTVRIVRSDGDWVMVLGSGDSVSVLVSSGQSQLLIATGDDRTAFGNAYGRVTPGPSQRPDIVLLAGVDRELNVPAFVLESFDQRQTYVIHPLRLTGLDLPNTEIIESPPVNPVRFTLGGHLSVIVESLPIAGKTDTYAWRATIARDQTQISIVSAWSDVPLFDWPRPPVTLVIASDVDGVDLGLTDARVIIGPSESLVPERLDDADSNGDEHTRRYIVPVRPGDIATLAFIQTGVELTSDGDVQR